MSRYPRLLFPHTGLPLDGTSAIPRLLRESCMKSVLPDDSSASAALSCAKAMRLVDRDRSSGVVDAVVEQEIEQSVETCIKRAIREDARLQSAASIVLEHAWSCSIIR